MKCFLVVNQLNNPVFLDFDEEFTKFVHKKAVEVGLQDPSQTADSAEVDTAVVTQLFSPLVLAQVPLDDQVQNPCTSIICPNGFLLVFKKVDDLQYIAISGDGKDTEEFFQKKIQVFIRLTKFLFGPVYTEIANCSASERASRWTFLKGLLRTWTHMATSDQTFLVEAVERLHVNQLVSEKCVGLLEKTVQKMQAADHPTQHAFLLVNTKLLALYSKHSSFELQTADILLTTLLAQDMFPSHDTLDDLMTSTVTYLAHQRKRSAHVTPGGAAEGHTEREEKSDEHEEEIHSAPTTPSQRSPTLCTDTDATDNPTSSTVLLSAAASDGAREGRESTESGHSNRGTEGGGDGGEGDDGGLERLMTTGQSGGTLSHKVSMSSNKESTTSSSVVETDYPPLSPQAVTGETAVPTSSLLSLQPPQSGLGRQSRGSSTDGQHSSSSRETPSDHSLGLGDAGSTSGSRSRSGTEQSTQSSVTQSSVSSSYWPNTIFLQTRSCQHAPHTLHCAHILPSITLVVLSQMKGYAAADPLCQVLNIVQDLLQGRRNKLSRQQGIHVHNIVSDLLRKAHNVARRAKRRSLQAASGDVLSRWENEMRDKLVGYLQLEEGKLMPPDLESPLMELQRRLKELFQQLFVQPGRLGGGEGVDAVGLEVVAKMKVRLQQELMDYHDYLSVKAQRNITMTSYLDDFPGLIHFIYVDRQFHQMTTPSFNIMSNHGNVDPTLFLREKVWTMYAYMMKKLQQGYTSVLIRDGDFYYSFFLWFEDSMGNQVAVEEPYKPDVDTPQPGTLTGSFYRQLQRQCFPQSVDGAIRCYEMFLMHVGLVTPQFIASHCQRLAHKLWEMSGEAYTPVNLL